MGIPPAQVRTARPGSGSHLLRGSAHRRDRCFSARAGVPPYPAPRFTCLRTHRNPHSQTAVAPTGAAPGVQGKSTGWMAHPKRFELLTPRFVVWCSIQLSYGCVGQACSGPHRPMQGQNRAAGRREGGVSATAQAGVAAPAGGSSRGRRMTNSVPSAPVFRSSSRPPWPRTSSAAMARPRPVPPLR